MLIAASEGSVGRDRRNPIAICTSMTTASANSAVRNTIVQRRVPRLPTSRLSFNARLTSVFDPLMAGIRPNTRTVAIDTPSSMPSTRPSIE